MASAAFHFEQSNLKGEIQNYLQVANTFYVILSTWVMLQKSIFRCWQQGISGI